MTMVKEVLRRLYHDLVLGRSRVRVVPASEDVKPEYPPVFIVGVYRSGTTLLRYILDSHSHICCPPETDFIADLSRLVNNDRSQGGLERMGFGEQHVIGKIRELCVYFFGNYAASHGKPRWADKTPRYVDYLDFLLRLFPEGQFIIIYRHGLDQSHSYTRGGTFMRDTLNDYCHEGEDLRVGGARYWRDKTKNLLEFQEQHPHKCISVLYEDLCDDPEGYVKTILNFINEPWEPEVLEFWRFDHDKGREDGRTMATREISVSKGHYHEWPPCLVEQCREIAEPVLSRLGYKV